MTQPLPPAYAPPQPGPRRAGRVPAAAAIGLIVAALTLVAGGVTVAIELNSEDDRVPPAIQSPDPAPVATAAGGCSEVVEEPATMQPYHLDPGEPLPQPELPATSGPHASTTAGAGIYTEPADEASVLHSMEHGYVVIWYDPETTTQETYDALTAVHGNQAEVIMAPYDLDASAVIFVSWERIQGCEPGADPASVAQAAASFIASYKNAPNAPEPFAM